MDYEKIAYNFYFEKISKTTEVYAAVSDENIFHKYDIAYNIASNTYEYSTINIIISSCLLIALIIYLIISVGHKKGEEGIYTNRLDKVSYELLCLLVGILLSVEIAGLATVLDIIFGSNSILTSSIIDIGIAGGIILGIAIYATTAFIVVTTIRRIKARIFWKNTLIYKFMRWIKTFINSLLQNKNETFRLAFKYGSFILIQCLLILLGINSLIFLLVLIAFWIYVFKIMVDDINAYQKIREKVRKIYNGENSEELNLEEFKNEEKQIAKELNDISGGLSNAINEAMKSERLKTELITNVSHDIKTPLTSIINYVDLMKKENIRNEKVKEYLEILDGKSQRLKKLTEDLVEASKASSGNIKLNIEKLNIKELINQVSGEFKDKFEERGLQLFEDLPESDIYVEADSRYMYRVLENMYVNISKYALENSRVYVDVKVNEEFVQIELKNVSQDKLNISVDELMQRFVRGDSARTTEGSGLGISIANSLTELQKGEFNIYLDGDLFKVVIKFKIA